MNNIQKKEKILYYKIENIKSKLDDNKLVYTISITGIIGVTTVYFALMSNLTRSLPNLYGTVIITDIVMVLILSLLYMTVKASLASKSIQKKRDKYYKEIIKLFK